jgi:hypothetical protein
MRLYLNLLLVLSACSLVRAESTVPLRSSMPHVISFFIKPYISLDNHQSPKIDQSLNRAFLASRLTPIMSHGIYALYGGFFTYSDYEGQIVIPRKHSEDTLTLIITPRITPVIIQGNTVHHFITDETSPAKWYSFERVKRSQVTKDNLPALWKVTKMVPPANRIIPPYALVLLEEPDLIEVQEQEIPTTATANLILPDLYIDPDTSTAYSALNFLKISNYFAPLRKLYRYGNYRYAFVLPPS